MAQIIKHRRGTLESLIAVTGSLLKGELVIATGSTNLAPTNGESIVFVAAADGRVEAVNRIMRGADAPNVFAAGTYNGIMEGIPYYASSSTQTPTLYLLGSSANETIDLIGNIQPFSTSVDSRLDSIEQSIGGGGGALSTRVSLLEQFTASQEEKNTTLATYTGSVDSKLTNLINVTGSYATTGSNTFVANQTINGSIILSNNGQIQIHSATANTLFGHFDGSTIYGPYYQMFGNNYASADQRGTAEFVFDTRNSGGGFVVAGYDGATWTRYFRITRDGNTQITGSLFVSGDISGSTLNGVGNVTLFSASLSNRLDLIESYTGSQEAKNSTLASYTASIDNKFTTLSSYTTSVDGKVDNLISKTGSYATTGSNTFYGTQTFSGSVYIQNDLIVIGSSSIQNISASSLNIGDNQITLNTFTPAIRFGGISVIDSGSTGGTGSLWWDSVNNHWLYEHPADSEASYNSAMLIAGPKNTGNLGEEVGLTNGRLAVAVGTDHISSSQISDDGATVNIPGELTVGTLTGIGVVATFSSSVDSRLDAVESSIGGGGSIGTRVASLEAFTSSQETKNNSLAAYTGSIDSKFTTLESVTSSLNTTTQSLQNRADNLELFTSSQEAKNTTLATYTGSIDTKFTTLQSVTASLISKTGSYATTGSNTFYGNQTIAGDVLPNTANTHSLGSLSNYWNEIYLHSTASIKFIENGTIQSVLSSTVDGGIQIGNVVITTSSIVFVDDNGNVTETVAQSSSVGSNSTFTTTASFQEFTSSTNTRLDNLENFSTSLDTTFVNQTELANATGSLINSIATKLSTASFETYTASVDISLSSINSYTSSLKNVFTLAGSDVTMAGNATIVGDLTVQGNTVTFNTTTLVVEDKLIELASGSTNAIQANGAGISVLGAGATFTYESTQDAWTFNKPLSGSAFTGSLNVPGGSNTKRIAFRGTTDNIEFVAAPTTNGDLVQWDGSGFVMSNVIDGGSF